MTVTPSPEARQKPRHRIIEAALIRSGDVSISCAIRNLSETGAALEVGQHSVVPDQFTLIVFLGWSEIYSCTVVWRKERRVGVSFLPADGSSKSAASRPTEAGPALGSSSPDAPV